MLASLSSSITSGIAHHGVYAVFALMLIDAVFPAVSELVMLYAGALAAGAIGGTHPLLFGSSLSFGATAFIVLALAGTLGYLAGGLIGWLIGIYGGRPLILRHGGWLHLNETRVSLAGYAVGPLVLGAVAVLTTAIWAAAALLAASGLILLLLLRETDSHRRTTSPASEQHPEWVAARPRRG